MFHKSIRKLISIKIEMICSRSMVQVPVHPEVPVAVVEIPPSQHLKELE